MNPVDAILAAGSSSPAVGVGTVVTTSPLVIRWYGSDQPAKRLTSYTPTVAHVVLVARTTPLVVLGQIV